MALGLVFFSSLQRLVACPKRREGEREGGGVSNWLNFIRWEFVLYLFILKNYVLFDLVWQLVIALGDSSSSKCKD